MASTRFLNFGLPTIILILAGVGMFARAAAGQSANRGTMAINDGTSTYVLHYSEPDIRLVTAPQFTLADVASFTAELSLSEAQQQAVRRAIEVYLEAFAELVKEKHPQHVGRVGAEQARTQKPGGKPGEGADAPDAPNDEGDQEDNAMRRIVQEELKAAGYDVSDWENSPYHPSIGIGVSLSDDGSGAPAEPEVNVNVSFGGEDDSLSPAEREKLQPIADKIAKRLAEHVKAHEAKKMVSPREDRTPREDIDAKWNQLQELRKRVAEFLKAKEALRQRLFTAIQAILSQPQIERWPRLIRTLTRIKTMP